MEDMLSGPPPACLLPPEEKVIVERPPSCSTLAEPFAVYVSLSSPLTVNPGDSRGLYLQQITKFSQTFKHALCQQPVCGSFSDNQCRDNKTDPSERQNLAVPGAIKVRVPENLLPISSTTNPPTTPLSPVQVSRPGHVAWSVLENYTEFLLGVEMAVTTKQTLLPLEKAAVKALSTCTREAALTKCTAWLHHGTSTRSPPLLMEELHQTTLSPQQLIADARVQQDKAEELRAKWRRDKNRLLLLSAPARSGLT